MHKPLIMRFLFILLLLVIISCSQTKEKQLESKQLPNLSKSTGSIFADDDNGLLKFVFPDSVELGTEARGILQYDLHLNDSLSEKLQDRFTFLYVTKDFVEGGAKEIAKRDHLIYKDTIGNGTYFFGASFNEKGEHIMSLAIEDNLILETEVDSMAMNHAVTELSIWHRVFVR